MIQRLVRAGVVAAAVSALWLLSIVVVPLQAQAPASGSVTGRVSDSTGAALPGAQISITALELRGVTDVQGEFTITNVPAGTHQVEVAYLGFRPVVQSVTVTAGQRARMTVALQPSISVEETVRATAIRDGQARALNQQRTADNVGNVVSADAIGRFPDPNIAEALQRTPGIGIERDQGEGRYINLRGAPADFTAVAINGVVLPALDPTTRALDLDTIPSDIVSQIEVSKSLRPDLDADSIAGAVNIVTQSPFDANGLRIRASGGGTHNAYGGNDSRASFMMSNVFGARQQFGALMSVSYSKTERQVENVESGWTVLTKPEGGQVMGLIENLFKDYDTRRTRMAATSTLDWRPSMMHRFSLSGSYARFEDDEYRNRLGISWEDGRLQAGATDSRASFTGVRATKQFRHRTQLNKVTSVSLGGRHFMSRAILDYTAAFSRGDQTYPNRNELLYRTGANLNLSYDYSADPLAPRISLFDTKEHLDPTRFSFRENTVRGNSTREDEWSAAANLELTGRLFGSSATHKFGVKARLRDKTADEERWRDRRSTAAPLNPMAFYLGTEPSSNFAYTLGTKFNPDLVRTYLGLNRTISEKRVPESRVADYEVGEDIFAGYASTKLTRGKADILVGLRVERTQQDTSAVAYNATTGVFTPVSASRSHTDLFPGITLRYAFSDKLIGRAAITRAINRPNFPDLVPRQTLNDEVSQVRVNTGNPDLKPTLSTNVDAAVEYYTQPLGIFAVGVFYKDLTDYRYNLTLPGTFNGRPAIITRPENAPGGRVLGAEVTWQRQFDNLPGFWAGFGAFANYTYTDAEMEVGRTYAGRSKFPLTNQSAHTTNAGLFFERQRFNARLSYTDRTSFLDELNADEPRLDLFWGGRDQLDLTASLQVSSNWEAYFEGKNLTNTAGLRYYGVRERTYEYEKFGQTYFFGVRFKY